MQKTNYSVRYTTPQLNKDVHDLIRRLTQFGATNISTDSRETIATWPTEEHEQRFVTTCEQIVSTKSVTLTVPLTLEQISDVLCSALEGGSNYWYFIEEYINPTTWEFRSEPKRDNGFDFAQDYPLNPGGALMISNKDDFGQGSITRLDLAAIQKGLAILGEKYPHILSDILSENTDAGTGDALLQCSLFGDIIYG
jgi:hypothetical protein